MSTYFLDPFEFPFLSYSGGIDLCIVHSCMYPSYFLPDFGPLSGEDLLQKWCNFCFSILQLHKRIISSPVLVTYSDSEAAYWHVMFIILVNSNNGFQLAILEALLIIKQFKIVYPKTKTHYYFLTVPLHHVKKILFFVPTHLVYGIFSFF